MASLADLAGDITVSVMSSADPAGVTCMEECGDGIGVPGDYVFVMILLSAWETAA